MLLGLFVLVIFIKAMELPIQIFFTHKFEKLGKRFSENRAVNKKNKSGEKAEFDDGPREAIFIDIND